MKFLMAVFVFCMCVLSSSGLCSGTNASLDTTLYFILGMVYDCAGRHIIEGDALVERFFPHERVSAAIFGERLEELRRSRSLADTIEQTVLGQGHIEFHAKAISALIDSCFVIDYSVAGGRAVLGVPASRWMSSTPETDCCVT